MPRDRTFAPSFWLRTTLLLTTRPARTHCLAQPVPQDWRVRVASLRWFAVWRNHPDAQRQLRAIILPEPWSDDAFAWQALCARQMHALGLVDEELHPAIQKWLERRLFDRVAAPWRD